MRYLCNQQDDVRDDIDIDGPSSLLLCLLSFFLDLLGQELPNVTIVQPESSFSFSSTVTVRIRIKGVENIVSKVPN